MAKVKFSALVSEMRNKLNGSVFARNRGGNYLRTKVTPTNPQTQAQVLARAKLAQFSQAWRSLTESQRSAWRSVVDQWSTTDVFGDVVNPTGSTLYTRLNINIANAGGVAISTPPTPKGAEALISLTLTAGAGLQEAEITFDPDTIPSDHSLVIESTPMLSPGINNANSRFRVVKLNLAGGESPIAFGTEQVAKFGAIVLGQKLFVRAKLIRTDTGEVSQALVVSAVVGA